MSQECSDCGGETERARLSRSGTGLPVRLYVEEGAELVDDRSYLDATSLVCTDCGRIRFRADVAEFDPGEADSEGASGSCPVCSGPTVSVRPGGSGFDVRLADESADVAGRSRFPLYGHACVDCGAVALYAADTDVPGGDSDVSCVSCGGTMRMTSPTTGSGTLRLIGDKRGESALAERKRTDPIAWACRDCGLSLFYDREARSG